MGYDEEALGFLPSCLDRLEQACVEAMSNVHVEVGYVAQCLGIGLQRRTQERHHILQVLAPFVGFGEGDGAVPGYRPNVCLLGTDVGRDQRLARTQYGPRLIDCRRFGVDQLGIFGKPRLDFLHHDGAGAAQLVDLASQGFDGVGVLLVGGRGQHVGKQRKQGCGLLGRILLAAYQFGELRAVCRRPGTRGGDGALHRPTARQVGDSKSLGGGVDAGLAFQIGTSDIGQKTDVGFEYHGELLISRRHIRILVIGLTGPT